MRNRDDLGSIGDLAATQHGLIARPQLRELSVSGKRADLLVAQGWLRPVHRGVYAVGHTALTQRGRWLAAVLAVGAGVLSHRANGALWQILTPGEKIDVTLTGPAGHVPRDVVVPHRRRIAAAECTVRHGVPCTTLVRTILDVAASEPPWVLADAFEEAQVLHKLAPVEVAEAVVLRRGHRGTARIRELLLDAVDPGEVQSRLELRFLRFCRDAGLPRPQTQHWIAGWPVDFFFDDVGLAVETDGNRFHASTAKRRRDARKTAAVEAAGVPVLRLTWEEVVDRASVAAARTVAARAAAATAPRLSVRPLVPPTVRLTLP